MNWGDRLKKVGSSRLGLGVAIAAGLVAYPFSLLSETLGLVVFFVLAGALMLGAVMNDDLVLYCPYCKKRVKAGATVCHHCQREVVG